MNNWAEEFIELHKDWFARNPDRAETMRRNYRNLEAAWDDVERLSHVTHKPVEAE